MCDIKQGFRICLPQNEECMIAPYIEFPPLSKSLPNLLIMFIPTKILFREKKPRVSDCIVLKTKVVVLFPPPTSPPLVASYPFLLEGIIYKTHLHVYLTYQSNEVGRMVISIFISQMRTLTQLDQLTYPGSPKHSVVKPTSSDSKPTEFVLAKSGT